ncbi:MAG: hypothetical protein Q8O40_13205 [Chloroflexota bacterium]|nr:hypothetical protein [Chloroflexota bacterium]
MEAPKARSSRRQGRSGKSASGGRFLFFWIACLLLFLVWRKDVVLPFDLPFQLSAIASRSMVPAYPMGSLVAVVAADKIEVGDVIAFRVPLSARETYGLPPRLLHRVVEYDVAGGRLKTKGDAVEKPDPFTVDVVWVLGKPRYQVPYLGFALLFLWSDLGKAWLVFVASAAVYPALAGRYQRLAEAVNRLLGLGGAVPTQMATPVLASEFIARTQEIERRQEQSQEVVSGSLVNFAHAMNEYAMHLSSHTEAVKGLAESAKDLRESARSQNQVFENLSGLLSRPPKAVDQGFEELLRRPSRDVDGLETIYTEVLRTRAAVEEGESAMRYHIEHLRRQNAELKSEIHDLSSAIHSLVAVMQASSEQPHPVTAEKSLSPESQERDNPLPSAAASSHAGVDQVKDVGASKQPDNAIFGDCPLPPRSQRKRHVSSA